MLNVTNAGLFDSLMTVDLDGQHVDLHNDYACIDIQYLRVEKSIHFLFRNRDDNRKVVLQFREVTIEVFSLNFSRGMDNATLDLFYRGRFPEDGALNDTSEEKGNYFYISFYDDTAFEIFAKEVIIKKES